MARDECIAKNRQHQRNDAPTHCPYVIQDSPKKTEIALVRQPLQTWHNATSGCSQIKTMEKRIQFDSLEKAREKSTAELRIIPGEFKRYLQKWHMHWHKCVDSEGKYFEKKL